MNPAVTLMVIGDFTVCSRQLWKARQKTSRLPATLAARVKVVSNRKNPH
jgi:hypothetical protein